MSEIKYVKQYKNGNINCFILYGIKSGESMLLCLARRRSRPCKEGIDMWIRYREKWNSGPAEWEFEYLNNSSDDDITEMFREKANFDYHYESFRGFDWEKIDLPSVEYLKQLIFETESVIFKNQKLLEVYRENLDTAEGGNLGRAIRDFENG